MRQIGCETTRTKYLNNKIRKLLMLYIVLSTF